MNLDIIKCHGSRNDFIIIDELKGLYTWTEEERAAVTRTISKRDGAVGSDGVLFVQPSSRADAKMRMLNSDGSEAEMCGNGLRCAARYVLDQMDTSSITVETMKADLKCAEVDEVFPGVRTFEVAIEPVSLRPATLPMTTEQALWINQEIPPLSENLAFTALSVPNPHLAAVTEKVTAEEAEETGVRANQLKELFPNGTNVSLIQLIQDNDIFVRTYERGVGLTNACGTAMSASSVVSVLLDYLPLDEVITVYNPGGMVQTVVSQDEQEEYHVKLRGNATFSWHGTVHLSGDDAELLSQEDLEEEEAYGSMAEAAAARLNKV
ncbi:diaminopimelate epimerase [Alkalicoccus chagannorensis]|uniref:diaminopimelate epimerase n=1 Tax=Alkalicoccus chagannorensis TaxID=427072 RepID=UPI0003FB3D32|nr:diaminopimelate epimerase [Alkalicoccus chagannorensis]